MSRPIPGLTPVSGEGTSRGGRPAARFKPRRVWIMDPERPFALKMARALARQGISADCLTSLTEVEAALQNDTPDLIVAALSLGNRQAQSLFEVVRDSLQAGHVPFFFVVRGGSPLEIVPGVKFDPTCMLKKPFCSREFLKGIAPLLRRLDRIQVLGRAASFSSTFSDIPLVDLIGILQRYERTGLLKVETGGRREPIRAWFGRGNLIHAEHPDGNHQEVLSELLLLPNARFEFRAGLAVEEQTIEHEAWLEVRDLLFHLDRGQMNPFPYAMVPQRQETSMPGNEGGREGS